MNLIENLEMEFRRNADALTAVQQKAYMRNQFEFLGIKTPRRREILRPFLNSKKLPPKQEFEGIVKTLWAKPEREYHYAAQELVAKYHRQLQEEDLVLYEFLITHNSWWDSVDFIAATLLGTYFQKYSEKIKENTHRWLRSGELWLQRSAILFQLKYKKNTDTELLVHIIYYLEGSREFFINKAIDWILREYSKTDPEWVQRQCGLLPLNSLSKREALKFIAAKGI